MKPVVIQVFGDKSRKLEPEHHRIEFPGGYISVDRTTEGDYWAHIAVVTEIDETHQGLADSKIGQVVTSRIDFNYDEYMRRHRAGEPVIPDIPGMADANHLAVRVKPTWRS